MVRRRRPSVIAWEPASCAAVVGQVGTGYRSVQEGQLVQFEVGGREGPFRGRAKSVWPVR